MFTRLDAERNGKILKRAVNEGRLSENSFSVIIEHMDGYVSLPSKRLAHIVRRYSHHRAMKDIGKFCMLQEFTQVFGQFEFSAVKIKTRTKEISLINQRTH